jgi:hypothetical protein
MNPTSDHTLLRSPGLALLNCIIIINIYISWVFFLDLMPYFQSLTTFHLLVDASALHL